GSPHAYLVSGIAAEECGRADFNAAYFPLMYGLIGELLARYAGADLQRMWLPKMAAGAIVPGLALTEPGAGSDAGALSCKAERAGDHYILTGEKSSISFCSRADLIVVFARTRAGGGANGFPVFCLPTDLSSVSPI